MHRRERWYHQRDNNRLVRPMEWGLEFVLDHVNGDNPRNALRDHSARVMRSSDDFYALPEIHDFQLAGDQLGAAIVDSNAQLSKALIRLSDHSVKQGQYASQTAY